MLRFHAIGLLPPSLTTRDAIAEGLPALPGAEASTEIPAPVEEEPVRQERGWFGGLFSESDEPSPRAREETRKLQEIL